MPYGVIDVHAHVCPAHFDVSPGLKAAPHMPCLCHKPGGLAELTIEGKNFRTLDVRSWDIQRRLDDMHDAGVTAQVLSPMPELLSYWFSPRDGEEMSDTMNGFIADMVARQPNHFAGLGMVPLQDVDLAIASLRRVKEVYHLAGVEIGTNITGILPGDPRFEPFWEAAASLNLAIFIHPLHPVSQKLENPPTLFHPLAGFLADTGFAGGSLLLSGVLSRHPTLRIGLSHGGGGLVPLIPRLTQAYNSMEHFRIKMLEPPAQAASRLFYDSNVYDTAYLTYLARDVAPGRVFLGTDYPYEIMQTSPTAYLASAALPEAIRQSLARGAAEIFLNTPKLGMTGNKTETSA
jgi:aminocarboxymuconate-semialdehyde decarboxylase